MRRLIATVVVLFMCTTLGFSQGDKNVKYEVVGDLVKATYYYEDGQIQQTGFFRDKKLEGLWVYFNEQGETISKGTYKNGTKTGKWVFYSNEGVKEVNYLNGKVVDVVQTDKKSLG